MITNLELEKLSVMYDGDKARDATSKIRGFLFQDYVTIMCLLKDQVKYVCSEYLEDIDVFFEDGTFEFIQVKYYPHSNPNMKEISTDLYYQYLRLQMLHSSYKKKPCLYIHRIPNVQEVTLEKMKTYIGLENKLPKSIEYPSAVDSETWLRRNVYITNKKEVQKEKLFASMASEKSLNEFVTKYNIIHQSNIKQYKKELMEALAKFYPNPNMNEKEEYWKLILLGLAISYIQRRYSQDNLEFEQIRVDKKDFDLYMVNCVTTKTELTIANYLVGVVCEEYGEIISNNELSDLQIHMLNRIYQNTLQWIKTIGKTVDGQYQLLNTLSTDEASKITSYSEESVESRLLIIAECKTAFVAFIKYLWKIILNICQDEIKDKTEFSANSKLFDIMYYMVPTVTDYVCLNFPKDKYVNHSVILAPAGVEFKGAKRKIVGRMVNISSKPEKWFFQNSKLTKGKTIIITVQQT